MIFILNYDYLNYFLIGIGFFEYIRVVEKIFKGWLILGKYNLFSNMIYWFDRDYYIKILDYVNMNYFFLKYYFNNILIN